MACGGGIVLPPTSRRPMGARKLAALAPLVSGLNGGIALLGQCALLYLSCSIGPALFNRSYF